MSQKSIQQMMEEMENLDLSDIEDLFPADEQTPKSIQQSAFKKAAEEAAELVSVLTREIQQLYESCQNLQEDIKEKEEFRVAKSPIPRSYMVTFASRLKTVENMLYDLARQSGMSHNELLKNAAKEGDPIDVTVTEHQVLIRMPRLPQRTLYNLTLHTDMLTSVMLGMKMPRFKRMHITFYHVFSDDTIFLARDVDNYSYKRVIDTIALMCGQTDSARYCTMSAYTVHDNSVPNGTYIVVDEVAELCTLPECFKAHS